MRGGAGQVSQITSSLTGYENLGLKPLVQVPQSRVHLMTGPKGITWWTEHSGRPAAWRSGQSPPGSPSPGTPDSAMQTFSQFYFLFSPTGLVAVSHDWSRDRIRKALTVPVYRHSVIFSFNVPSAYKKWLYLTNLYGKIIVLFLPNPISSFCLL